MFWLCHLVCNGKHREDVILAPNKEETMRETRNDLRGNWVCSLVLLAGVVAACGGAPTGVGTPSTPSQASSDGPPTPWEGSDPAAKAAWMSGHVTPTMGKLFREFDPVRYADFGCATCHGARGPARGFAMPSPELPVLPAPEGDWAAYAAARPKMMQFMSGPVKQTMAGLLGLPPHDAKTGTGFGCYHCHTHE